MVIHSLARLRVILISCLLSCLLVEQVCEISHKNLNFQAVMNKIEMIFTEMCEWPLSLSLSFWRRAFITDSNWRHKSYFISIQIELQKQQEEISKQAA